MSVSRGGTTASIEEYGDVDHLYYRGTMRNNGLGDNASVTVQSVGELSPAGGITRSEEAELVALKVHFMRAEIDPAAVTTAPEAGRLLFELSRDDTPGPLGQDRTQKSLDGLETGGSDTWPDGGLSRQKFEVSNDVLWFAATRFDATGNGRDRHPSVAGHIQAFRDWFGRGPMFQSQDELHLHGRINNIENQSNWVGDIGFSTYWVVSDRE